MRFVAHVELETSIIVIVDFQSSIAGLKSYILIELTYISAVKL